MTRNNTLWVVEINCMDGKGWLPTTDAALTRDDGRRKLLEWQTTGNGSDKTRLRKYVPQ